MYRVDRNNFYQREKKATIYTPEGVSNFIFELIASKIDRDRPVLDPCVGAGSLLKPFKKNGFRTIGIDIEDQGFPWTRVCNYLAIKKGEIETPSLVIMNPPFNIDEKSKWYISRYYGRRPLLPEVWMQKAIELFGRDIPMVLFTPYGLRLNQQQNSRRWLKFVNGEYPEIVSIISLPKNIFSGILFHSEILIFNIASSEKGRETERLKGHYFYCEQAGLNNGKLRAPAQKYQAT